MRFGRRRILAEQAMKVMVQIRKDGRAVYKGIIDATDAESFGKSWAEVWSALSRRSTEAATSIGALYERLNDNVLDQLNGAEISLTRVRSIAVKLGRDDHRTIVFVLGRSAGHGAVPHLMRINGAPRHSGRSACPL
jgi:hypothetical protein